MRFLLAAFLLVGLCSSAQTVATRVLYSAGGGVPSGGGGVSPAWVGENTRGFETAFTTQTSIVNVASSMTAGNRAVIVVNWRLLNETITGVTDSKGNSWSVDRQQNFSSTYNQAVCSAHLSSALTSSDTITITWSSSHTSYRSWLLAEASGIATSSMVDASATNNSFGTSVSVSGSTTTANTFIFGALLSTSTSATYGSSAWTGIGAAQDPSGSSYRVYYLRTTETASGTKNPNGSYSGNETWGGIWCAYK